MGLLCQMINSDSNCKQNNVRIGSHREGYIFCKWITLCWALLHTNFKLLFHGFRNLLYSQGTRQDSLLLISFILSVPLPFSPSNTCTLSPCAHLLLKICPGKTMEASGMFLLQCECWAVRWSHPGIPQGLGVPMLFSFSFAEFTGAINLVQSWGKIKAVDLWRGAARGKKPSRKSAKADT